MKQMTTMAPVAEHKVKLIETLRGMMNSERGKASDQGQARGYREEGLNTWENALRF